MPGASGSTGPESLKTSAPFLVQVLASQFAGSSFAQYLSVP